MEEQRARALHQHREFLHDAHDDPAKLKGATVDQICALLHLLCAIFRNELTVPQSLKKEFEALPNARDLKRTFQPKKAFQNLLKKTAEEPDFGSKILSLAGKAGNLALKAFKWLF